VPPIQALRTVHGLRPTERGSTPARFPLSRGSVTTLTQDSSSYGPLTCSPPKATLSWRFNGRISPSAGHQLRGCLATTPAGLSPASPSQLAGHTPIPDLVQVAPQILLEVGDRALIHPGAPLLAFTCRYASHTSHLEMSNGLPDDFSSSTRFLPDTRLTTVNKPRRTRPLRSTPITGASPLLQAGPPARPATVLRPSRSHPAWAAPCRHPPPGRPHCRDAPSHVLCGSRTPGSRRLHAGHHLAKKRAPARLIPE
jgi:hypothetical protein